jgi:RNA polymerase sigma factor (sigma-70 family)
MRDAIAHLLGHGQPLAVNPTSASPISCATPCLLGAAEETRWFKEEIRPHERELRAYLRARFPMMDADDLVQETYARVLRARQVGHATPTRAYLFVVARNVALDLVRREKVVAMERLGNLAELSVVEERPDAAETLSHEQELALLDAAMRALPPRCREILTLRRIEGLSHRAIAEKLGIAEGTVNAQLAIGVMRCRQFLCAHGVARACVQLPAGSNPSSRVR